MLQFVVTVPQLGIFILQHVIATLQLVDVSAQILRFLMRFLNGLLVDESFIGQLTLQAGNPFIQPSNLGA